MSRIMRMLAAIGLLAWSFAALADDEPLVGGHPDSEKSKQAEPPNKDGGAKERGKKPDKIADNKSNKNKGSETKGSEKPGKVGNQARKKTPVAEKKTPEAEREEAALLLVRQHQPELLELLNRLKGTKEKDYQQAIRELSRDSQRINSFKEKDPQRFDLEIRAWQLDSRIRLLTAKLSLEDRPELQEDLKAALAERADLRLAQRRLERERVAARLTKLDEDIAALVKNRDEDLKKTFDRLLRAAERARPKSETEAKKGK